jgi:hypothetical protein
MAKQLVNPIERHVEKAVLGLTGLALVAVIALCVVTSPNQIELGQEKVSPSTIDGKVAQKAADVVGKLRAASPKTSTPPSLFDDFTGSLQPLERTPLPVAVAIGPEVPILDAAERTTGQAELVKVNRPDKPTVSHGRGTIVVAGAGGQQSVPVDWVTVSAMFNVKAQSELQRLEYGATRDEVIFAPPEIQRRLRLPNGSWSDGDWVDVKAWPSVGVPSPPTITFFDEGGKLIVNKDQLKVIEKFNSDLQHSKMQLDILRPMPPGMALPTRWALPIIPPYSYRDVMKQDDEYLSESPSPDPADRYGLSGEAPKRKEAAAVEPLPAEKNARILQDGQKLLESARQNKSENDAIKAYNCAQDVLVDRAVSAADKAKAEKLKADATQVQNDIKRWIAAGGGNAPAPGPLPPGGRKPREKLPVQQVWAHDAAVSSIRNGETYQYRMRFRIYNRLAGAPDKFKKPELAATVFITGDWSEPSDPVVIEPATKFFITSDNQKDEEVGVEFFQWFGGVWVKPTRRIKATVGETIRDRQRVPAPAIDNPEVVDNPEVDFVADATIVDIDFDRAFRERKAGTTPKGVKFGQPSPSCSVVFVDSQGRLHERLVSLDKVHPEKREMTSRVWIPAKPK